jgi:hypothetical protein
MHHSLLLELTEIKYPKYFRAFLLSSWRIAAHRNRRVLFWPSRFYPPAGHIRRLPEAIGCAFGCSCFDL